MKKFFVIASTLFGVGYNFAPGTLASFITCIFIWILKFVLIPKQYLLLTFILTIASFYIVEKALNYFKAKDPQQIVLDEVVGCFITFINITNTNKHMLIGFLLFRFFDITKICGIHYFQKLPRSAGVFLDDMVAGIFSNVILQLLIMFSWI